MSGYRIGIDLGGTNIKAGIVGAEHRILAKASCPTGAQRPWQAVAEDMIGLARQLLAQNGLSAADCVGVGVGCPGTIDAAAGAAKGCASAVLLTLGTGVGGGVVWDGKVFEGGPGGMELGHTLLCRGRRSLHLRAQGLHRGLLAAPPL